MTKAVRTIVRLAVSLALFSGLALAQASGNQGKTDKNKEHHSRLAKVAFWRHHKHSDKDAKQAQVKQAQSKQVHAKPAQIKSVPAEQSARKNDQKQEQHASNSKASAKKAPAVNKVKTRQKAQDPKTLSLQQ